MNLRRVTDSKDNEVIKLIALYEDTFPESERYRDTQILLDLIDNSRLTHFNAIYENYKLAGLFVYWDLGEFCYIHFLAIFPEMRNRKIGKQILDWVSKNISQPVLLEVEVPTDEFSIRRIHFYERNNYQVLAKNPDILYESRERSSVLWLMGNHQVKYLRNYITTIKNIVYDATGK